MNRLARLSPITKTLLTPTSSRAFSLSSARMAEKSSMDADKGSVGSQFKADGAVGGTAQKVGGPFDKDGAVGKQFKEDGAIGGTAQEAAETAEGKKPSAFDKDGMIGKQFKADGAIGGTAQAVGGPFDKDGAVGKHFNADGTLGGTVQENLGDKK